MTPTQFRVLGALFAIDGWDITPASTDRDLARCAREMAQITREPLPDCADLIAALHRTSIALAAPTIKIAGRMIG